VRARRKELGPRGRKAEIVGEELILLDGAEYAELYEVLECGHRQRGRYNHDGDSCGQGGKPVVYRICRSCALRAPVGPPGKVVRT
jgi:hypothetical protein